MGQVSSCCSVDGNKDKKEVIRPEAQLQDAAQANAPTQAEVEEFRERLEKSISMIVVIADGKRIPCRLRWTSADNSLVMSCDVNNHLHIRRMALTELLSVIHGRKDLGRVATKANIVDDPTCVALHLASNTCIPICLETAHDKDCFVELMKRLKE